MKYLGIDFGKRKVGLALSEGQVASAFKVIEVNSLKDSVEKLKKIIKDEDISRVVIGVPEGSTGKMVKNFSKNLEKELMESQVEVIEVDETLSSQDAKKMLIELNFSKKARAKEDAYSAMLILQRFLNNIS